MPRLTRRPPRAMAVARTWNDGTLIDWYSPRNRATDWLAGKIIEGQAGLDPYDASVFILAAGANEPVWGRRAIELCGLILDHKDTPDGGRRFRAVLEADVRATLHLDAPDAPFMLDEPLASRGVLSLVSAMEQTAELFHGPQAPIALARARAAYDERYPEGA